jgi:hypothetical protein
MWKGALVGCKDEGFYWVESLIGFCGVLRKGNGGG